MPQGSFLGPLLFILYINDISSIMNTEVKIFADDVTLYKTIRSTEDCEALQTNLVSAYSGCSLRWNSTVKYLVVVLNTKLTWDDKCVLLQPKQPHC